MPEFFYVYPAYLGQGLSRADGRRVVAGDALAELTVDEIAQAAKRLGYKAEVQTDKQYPRDTSSLVGRVKVAKHAGVTKTQFLHLLTAELRARRPPRGKT